MRRDVRSPSKLNEERLDSIVSVLRIEELLHNLLVPSSKQLSRYLYLSAFFCFVNLKAEVTIQLVRHIDSDVLVRCHLALRSNACYGTARRQHINLRDVSLKVEVGRHLIRRVYVLDLASAVLSHTDGDLFGSVLQGLNLYVLYYAIRMGDVELLSRWGSGRSACPLLLSDELLDDRLKHSLSLSLLLLLGLFTPSLQASLYLVSAGLVYLTLVTCQRVYLTPRRLELVHNGIEDALIELALACVLYVSTSGFLPRATEHLLKVSYLLLVYLLWR